MKVKHRYNLNIILDIIIIKLYGWYLKVNSSLTLQFQVADSVIEDLLIIW